MPPKDGTMFIGFFKSYPTPLATMWSGFEGEWAAAVPHTQLVDGEWSDVYFETEWFEEFDLVSWNNLPDWETRGIGGRSDHE